MHTEFWWGNLSKREHLQDIGVDNSQLNVKELGREVVDTRTYCGLMCIRQ